MAFVEIKDCKSKNISEYKDKVKLRLYLLCKYSEIKVLLKNNVFMV